MKYSFTAIDFETANSRRSSICSVGLIRVVDNEIVHEFSTLVKPPNNIYWEKLSDIHGIKAADTINAPSFDEVWMFIEPYIHEQHVVAHCGFTFDFNCLEQILDYYEIARPVYEKHCTHKLYEAKLDVLCKRYNIPLNHHDALSDAKACAELYKMYLNKI